MEPLTGQRGSGGRNIQFRLSFGFSFSENEDGTLKETIAKADKLMYVNKMSKRKMEM